MLNQVSNEALHSAKYVENYLDAVENLPDEIQRLVTRIRELDVKHRSYLRDVDIFYEQWANCPSSELLEGSNATKRNRAMTRIHQSLIAVQEIGDEKLNIVQQLNELIEGKTRQLDQNFVNLDYGKEEQMLNENSTKDNRPQTPSSYPTVSGIVTTSFVASVTNVQLASCPTSSTNPNIVGNGDRVTKRMRRARTDTTTSVMETDAVNVLIKPEINIKQLTNAQSSSINQKKIGNVNANAKKKRKKAGRQSNQATNRDNRDDTPPVEESIDPDEPTYCLCDQISFGEMILCDNDLCPIEWFHFSCVALISKPKGKWYCPNCRGDRPNVMKPKAQFLKELERYNREKEEKT